MRVLYLSADPGVPVFGGKGASVHVRAMIGAFAELGHEVTVASPRLEPGQEELPVEVHRVEIPAVRPRSLSTPAEVRAAIDAQTAAVMGAAEDLGVDAIYERYSLTGCAGARTARALGIPLILEVNAPLREEERRFRDLAHEGVALEAERATFAAAGMIIAVSPWLADWLGSVGVDAGRIAVIPNPPPDRPIHARPVLAEGNPLTVGFSGSLKPWHGVETLVQGFLAAAQAGGRMRLEILGHGPAAAAVDALADGSPLIRRVGHVPHSEALARIATWDVGVAPYRSLDNFYFSPLKLTEYMAAGLCVVVSRVGPLPELVEGGAAGVIVPPDDPAALAAELLALESDRPRLRRLAARGQAIVRAQPGWLQIAERATGWMSQAGATATLRSTAVKS